MDKKEPFTYNANFLKEISFPLGGIGTGSIGLGGDGRLKDWEIFNKPNKGSMNRFSHFAIKAEYKDGVIDARVLNGDLLAPYSGEGVFYGFGPLRYTMAGIPHFKSIKFKGEYPFAVVEFSDPKFPGEIRMTAFNLLIPLNYKDSSIPGAFFEIEIFNKSDREIEYTTCLSLSNPFQTGTTFQNFKTENRVKLINLSSDKFKKNDPEFGDLTIATDSKEISYQEYWYRGAWFDNLNMFWNDFVQPGKLKNRFYDKIQNYSDSLIL